MNNAATAAASLATVKWSRKLHPTTGVAVYIATIPGTLTNIYGETRAHNYVYRVAPDNIRDGSGGWRADEIELMGAVALLPDIFRTAADAKRAILARHQERRG